MVLPMRSSNASSNHRNITHKVYRCSTEGCPRSLIGFETKQDLSRHEKSVHGARIRFPCGKMLSNREDNNLKRHTRSCTVCHDRIDEIRQSLGIEEGERKRGRRRKNPLP